MPRALGSGGVVTFVGQPETAFDVAAEAAANENDSAFQQDPGREAQRRVLTNRTEVGGLTS